MDKPVSIEKAYCASGTGEGWYPIVQLCENALDGILGEGNWTPAQVKEKFGGLRFYYDASSDLSDDQLKEARKFISALEQLSYSTCEITGKFGKARRDLGWIRTLSDGEYEKIKAQKELRESD